MKGEEVEIKTSLTEEGLAYLEKHGKLPSISGITKDEEKESKGN